jgi:hypothetical protein
MPDDAALPDGPVLVVSPEMGEAAMSCSALLERSSRITVLDVFTSVPEPDRATEWDRACGFAPAKEAMAARNTRKPKRSHRALTRCSHRPALARYRDDLHGEADERHLRDAVLGCGPLAAARSWFRPAPASRRRSVWELLRWSAVDTCRTQIPIILGPRSKSCAAPAVGVWMYEELPHLQSQRRQLSPSSPLVRPPLSRTVPVDRTAKARRIAAYRSQFPARFGVGSLRRLRRRLPAHERYWALDLVPVSS